MKIVTTGGVGVLSDGRVAERYFTTTASQFNCFFSLGLNYSRFNVTKGILFILREFNKILV